MLGVLGLIFVIVAPVFVYRFARQNGRNAVAWTLAALAAGLGIQIFLPIVIIFAIGIIMLALGSTPDETERHLLNVANIMGIPSLVASILAVILIMRQVAKLPEEKSFDAPPAPPENF